MTTFNLMRPMLVLAIINFSVRTVRAQTETDIRQVLSALAKVDATIEVAETVVEKGTALAIGRHGNTVYFVTAEHVLHNSGTLAHQAIAQIPGCPTPLTVELSPSWVFSPWKIALFSVELPNKCRGQLNHIHFNLARGEIANLNAGTRDLPIKIVGRGTNDEITALGNAIAGSDGDHLTFEYPTREGTSGGVAVTERGELLCVVQDARGGSMITNAVLAANARDMPTNFLGPHAKVRIDGLPEHAQVSIDNGSVEAVKPVYHLLPRSHQVYVEAHGYQPATGNFSFGLDGLSLICANMEQEIDTAWRAIRWPLLGLGAVLLSTGGTFGLLALDAHGDFVDNPSRSAFDRTERYNAMADVTVLVGAVALGTFAVGHLVWNASRASTIQRCR